MIAAIIISVCYVGIGLLIYSEARFTEMPKREQLKYSIAWPWLFIATVGCIIWDVIFPDD